jgi:hypothetical protein
VARPGDLLRALLEGVVEPTDSRVGMAPLRFLRQVAASPYGIAMLRDSVLLGEFGRYAF